ncbi:hypothetical protein [Streptomyces sp. NBC_01304]|uniref:hypothetical protein n=1 Tax=Streptomyces sp. NBC_01304 TaxID=2903818 RepID=UPI002E0FA9D3|nr:hypothetical protein OG430_49330 [Streptomyces sp. NBC_01304]
MASPPAPRDAYAAAAMLDCSVDQVGRCAQCTAYTQKYGRGGGPLCAGCREKLAPAPRKQL